MRFTAMFRYGLRALALMTERYGQQPVSAREMASEEEISPSFLEQLLAHLRRHDIIVGVRGPGGGFRLKRPPEKIFISEVVEALEGQFYVSSCLNTDCQGRDCNPCDRYDYCIVVPLLRRLEEDITGVLSSYSLLDIHRLFEERERAAEQQDGQAQR